MTTTLWIVLGVSVVCVIGFGLVMRSQLQANKKLDSDIDYTKLRPWEDDEEEDEEKR